MNVFEGKIVAKDIRIGIVVARFNEFITDKLLGGAVDGLKRHEVSEDLIDVALERLRFRWRRRLWRKVESMMR